ncbi:MAG: ATPase P [Deltaproteobacteria bacterium]|nr:ATPase P [Deltaproteobacteria bacterium]
MRLQIPGAGRLRLTRAVFDFNGTLAADGRLLPGVGARLRRLARVLDVDVLTADTFGTAKSALAAVPVAVRLIRTGSDKRRLVSAHGGGVVAVGNGRNDVAMFRAAALAVAVIGTEGAAPEAIASANIVVSDVRDAVDLLLRPQRLVATLRR